MATRAPTASTLAGRRTVETSLRTDPVVSSIYGTSTRAAASRGWKGTPRGFGGLPSPPTAPGSPPHARTAPSTSGTPPPSPLDSKALDEAGESFAAPGAFERHYAAGRGRAAEQG